MSAYLFRDFALDQKRLIFICSSAGLNVCRKIFVFIVVVYCTKLYNLLERTVARDQTVRWKIKEHHSVHHGIDVAASKT